MGSIIGNDQPAKITRETEYQFEFHLRRNSWIDFSFDNSHEPCFEIDLSINRLEPEFPSLSTNLATLKLKNNSLRSGIPSEIKDFDLLQRFDVLGNKLVGPIPSPLVNLTFVDISNNFLIGKLPACIGSNTTNRTVLSSWNCLTSGGLEYQHPYSFCQKEALAVIPPNMNCEGWSKGKLGLILGIVGGVVGAVFAVGLLILIIFRREKKKKKKDDSFECDSFVLEKSSVRREPAIDGRYVPQTMTMLSMGLPPYHVFPLEEMEDVTNNFDPSTLAGEGSQGQDGHCIVTYQNHHPNTASTILIVLEHVANGSLRDRLTEGVSEMTTENEDCSGDCQGNPVLALRNHSRNQLQHLIAIQGSESPLNGQDNPNRLSSTESAEKNDIYQLGVILLEVISGKPITSETQLLERGLAESPLRLREAIDPSIRGTFAHESLKTAVEITMKCLNKDSISHPTIEDVLWHMQYSIQVQEGWTSSGNLSTKVWYCLQLNFSDLQCFYSV
ncbi:unnamed protein product [Camellia sinensis]